MINNVEEEEDSLGCRGQKRKIDIDDDLDVCSSDKILGKRKMLSTNVIDRKKLKPNFTPIAQDRVVKRKRSLLSFSDDLDVHRLLFYKKPKNASFALRAKNSYRKWATGRLRYSNFTGTDSRGKSGGTNLFWKEGMECNIVDLNPHWIHVITKDPLVDLVNWNKMEVGNIHQKIKILNEKLMSIQSNLDSHAMSSEEKDRNTSYFHKVVKKRRAQNSINSIKDMPQNWLSDVKEI
ncbi:uncharacterized protein G2W53_017736 [Senna tora]|uniref:Uncharacterized protein n=1 Tax=Senna tora TaxID=362788 RepID=A0A834TSH7_9FABA|nr:uncharacterized protein G2W53_017736 [Senna tora]